MFGFFKKQNDGALMEERIGAILPLFYEEGDRLRNTLKNEFSNDSILVTLEIYGFLQNVADFFIVQNKVNQNIRRMVYDAIWGVIPIAEKWRELHIDESELNRFIDDRSQNYAKIMNHCRGLNTEYFDTVMKYQVQLFSSIIKKGKLSFYNPLPNSPFESSPLELDILVTSGLNNVLTDFYTGDLIDFIMQIGVNLVDDYFIDPNYKHRSARKG